MSEPEWSYEEFYGQHFVRRRGVLAPIVVPDQETAQRMVSAMNGALAMQLEAAQAALADAIASNTAWADDAAALASVVTRQRSEIDTLRADLDLKSETAEYWESGCRQTQAQLDTARALLMDCWHQLDGDVYVLPGGEVHPGAVTTIHDLHAFLWPEGKTI